MIDFDDEVEVEAERNIAHQLNLNLANHVLSKLREYASKQISDAELLAVIREAIPLVYPDWARQRTGADGECITTSVVKSLAQEHFQFVRSWLSDHHYLLFISNGWYRVSTTVLETQSPAQTTDSEPAEQPQETPPPSDLPALTDLEYLILKQLADDAPQALKIIDLYGLLKGGKTATSNAVRRLESLGFVQSLGPRSGVAISAAGLAALKPCDRPQSA